jgi:hypothetical protein
MSTYTLIQRPEKDKPLQCAEVKISFEAESLDDMLSQIECFLRACGYGIGHLEEVSEDTDESS